MNIIVFLPNWIGDVIMSLPFLKQLEEKTPNNLVTILGQNWSEDILMQTKFQYNYNLILYDRTDYKTLKGFYNLIKQIKKKNFTHSFVLSESLSSALLFMLSNIPNRIGYATQGRSVFLNNSIIKDNSFHRTQQFLSLLLNIATKPDLSMTPKGLIGDVSKRTNNKTFKIGMHAHSQASSRRWPTIYWIRLIKWCQKNNLKIILFGNKAAAEISTEIIRDAHNISVTDYCGKLSIKNSINKMKECNLFISNDSGPMHIAHALGIPTIGIWGAGDKTETGMQTEMGINLSAGAYCSPCIKNKCTNNREPMLCLNSIVPEMIFNQIKYYQAHGTFNNI